MFGPAVLDNSVSLGAIIFAVHLPSAAGQSERRTGSAVSTAVARSARPSVTSTAAGEKNAHEVVRGRRG